MQQRQNLNEGVVRALLDAGADVHAALKTGALVCLAPRAPAINTILGVLE